MFEETAPSLRTAALTWFVLFYFAAVFIFPSAAARSIVDFGSDALVDCLGIILAVDMALAGLWWRSAGNRSS